jgi:S1-C subfamily serine protease
MRTLVNQRYGDSAALQSNLRAKAVRGSGVVQGQDLTPHCTLVEPASPPSVTFGGRKTAIVGGGLLALALIFGHEQIERFTGISVPIVKTIAGKGESLIEKAQEIASDIDEDVTRQSGSDSPEARQTKQVMDRFVETVERVSPMIVKIYSPLGTGSGVYFHDRYLITNAHVVQGQNEGTRVSEVLVEYPGRSDMVTAKVIAVGHRFGYRPPEGEVAKPDLAILELPEDFKLPEGFEPVKIRADLPQIREFIWAYGNPVGYDDVLTTGYIRANDLDRSPPGATLMISARLNPGNSGGGLLDADGNLVGINVAMPAEGYTQPDGTEVGIGLHEMGFAIDAHAIVDFIREAGLTIETVQGSDGASQQNILPLVALGSVVRGGKKIAASRFGWPRV